MIDISYQNISKQDDYLPARFNHLKGQSQALLDDIESRYVVFLACDNVRKWSARNYAKCGIFGRYWRHFKNKILVLIDLQ